MGFLGLGLALLAVVGALLPMPGMFVGMGLAILAIGLGAVAYRQKNANGWSRLAGAAAIPVALLGLFLSGARYAMTLWAIKQLDSLL